MISGGAELAAKVDAISASPVKSRMSDSVAPLCKHRETNSAGGQSAMMILRRHGRDQCGPDRRVLFVRRRRKNRSAGHSGARRRTDSRGPPGAEAGDARL